MTEVVLETAELVAAEINRLGLTRGLASVDVDKLARYVSLVVRWGRRINLTGRPEAAVFIQRQLPDGLVLADRLLSTTTQQRVSLLDVGTGAGIPGIVVGLACPQLRVTLVEPNQRRCSFLRTVIFELEMSCHLLDTSLEQVAPQLVPAQVSLVCSRATWPPVTWLERAQHLVGAGGEVVTFLSGDADDPRLPPTLVRTDELSYQLLDGTRRRQLFLRRVSRETPLQPRFT
jgi:16S rRNA (guanine(527)-N(7))-methyltransferase RsmG